MIEELTLQGFKSYRSRQTVRFSRGVNKISGRNAAGKTTILEAVLFALFGDVPGVRKQDLLPLGGGELSVTVTFKAPYSEQKVKVHREGVATKDGGFRGKSYLDVEGENHAYTGERDIQSKLRELLGVGKGVFFNVVYAQQKEFVEILNPPRNRMDAILGLTTPVEIREQLKDVKRSLEERGGISGKGAIEERIRNAEASIADCEDQLQDVCARRDELSKGLGSKMADLNVARDRVEAVESFAMELRGLENRMNELEVLRGRLEDRQQELEERYEELGAEPEVRRAELQDRSGKAETTEDRLRRILEDDLTAERRRLDASIARLSHQLEEHRELVEQGVTVCPKCGQEIDPALLEADMAGWSKEIDERNGTLKGLEKEIADVQDQIRRARQRKNEAEVALKRFLDQLHDVEALKRSISQLKTQGTNLGERIRRESQELLARAGEELAAPFEDLDDARGQVEKQLRALRDELARVDAEVRFVNSQIQECERREREIEVQLKGYGETLEASRKILDRIVEYEAKIRAVESIVEHYGEYEKLLRENTLRQQEWLTYKYFQRLTDQQVYSGCHIDRERYILEVQPQGSGRLLPAWRAGGGHESLFALSERLALLRVMGFPHLLILDEPTDAVDSENVPQLLEYIARSSNEIGQVLLVTHHGHGEEEGVNLIRVRKAAGESRVFQELVTE